MASDVAPLINGGKASTPTLTMINHQSGGNLS